MTTHLETQPAIPIEPPSIERTLERYGALEDEIAQLRQRQHNLLVWAHDAGLSWAKIGNLTGFPETTVHDRYIREQSRIRRGVQ